MTLITRVANTTTINRTVVIMNHLMCNTASIDDNGLLFSFISMHAVLIKLVVVYDLNYCGYQL